MIINKCLFFRVEVIILYNVEFNVFVVILRNILLNFMYFLCYFCIDDICVYGVCI